MRLGLGEKIGYGLGDTASHLVFDSLVLFLMYYYTNVVGLDPAAVGLMFLVSRVFDGVVDFSMGLVADRTRTRFGRFRPWILWMAIPFGVLAIATFSVPQISDQGRLIYAWISYTLLMIAYSMVNIPYGALSGVMTSDPIERTGVNAWRMALARTGSIIVSGATIWLVTTIGQGDEYTGYQGAMLVFAVVAVGLYLICFATTRERIDEPEARSNNIGTDLRMLTRNKPWVILFILGIVLFANMIAALSSTIYYVKNFLGQPALISTFMLAGSLAAFAGVPFTKPLVKRFGKKATFIGAQTAASACLVAMYFVPADQINLILGFRAATFVFIWLASPLLWAMIGDSADYADVKLGVRATGVIFSAATCAHKVGMGLGGAVVVCRQREWA